MYPFVASKADATWSGDRMDDTVSIHVGAGGEVATSPVSEVAPVGTLLLAPPQAVNAAVMDITTSSFRTVFLLWCDCRPHNLVELTGMTAIDPDVNRAKLPARLASTNYVSPMDLPEIELGLQDLVASIPESGRAEILRILTIRDDAERAREVGRLHRSGVLPATAELLIDAEEEPALRAALVGMIREIQM
jgi:hypothetical protein